METVVVTADLCGFITSWNRGAERFTGISAKDIVGKHFREIFTRAEDIRLAEAIMVEALHRGNVYEGEFPFQHQDGSHRTGVVTVKPTVDHTGAVTQTVSTFIPAHSESPAQAFGIYLIKERGLSPLTAYTYEHSIRTLERWLGKERGEVTVGDVRRFIREADYHPSTRNGVLRALKAYRRFGAIEEWWSSDDPIMALAGPKVPHEPKRALNVLEARRVFSMCERPNDYRLIGLGLFAGLRVSESAALEEGSWEADRIRVEKGKGGKAREVPVHPTLVALREVIFQRPKTSAGALKHTCRSLSHTSGIPFTTHTLRRTFSQRMAELGVGREVIGALLGHAPLSVTETYAPVTWDERRMAIARLGYSE